MTSVDGLVTGLDTSSIIEQLLSAERIPQNQLLVKKATAEARADVFADLRSRYDAVRTAARDLDLPDDWSQLAASSTSDLVTVSAGRGTITGSLEFTVLQRARAHAVYSTDTLGSLDAVVAAGGSVFSARDIAPLGFSALEGAGLAVGVQTFEVTQASAAAVKPGDTALGEGVTIDAGNDTLEVTVNGVARSLALAHGTYATRDDLAAAVGDAVAAVAGLAAQLTVRVNPVDQLELLTVREGSEATLQVTGGSALAALGLGVDGATITGVDGVATVNGIATSITTTDPGTEVVLDAGTGTITATLAGPVRLGTADVEQVSFGGGTLQEVVAAINGAGGSGTRAAVVQVAEGQYRLQLTATTTGDGSAIDLDLGQFTGLASGFTTLSTGQDASLRIEGTTPYTVSSADDTFEDLLPGVDVTLAGVPAGPVTVDVRRDGSALADRVTALVDAVNRVLEGMAEVSAYDADDDRASLLTGNGTIRRARDELTAALLSPVAGAALGSVGLTGVTITADGSFEFDRAAFDAAFAADPAAVERVYALPFGASGSSAMARVLAEVDDATAFGTGYLRTAEDAEIARVEDLDDSIAAWDRRLEVRERVLRSTFIRLETALAELQAQSTWLAGQIAALSTPSTDR